MTLRSSLLAFLTLGGYLALGVTLTGCLYSPDLHIHIVADDGDPVVEEFGRQAVDAWGAMGFVNDERGTQVTIKSVMGLRTHDEYANTLNGHADLENSLIEVEAGLMRTENAFLHTIVHELGHIIMNTGDHLTMPGKMGVMLDGSLRPQDSWPTMVTQDDLDLACRFTGICVTL
jgi:hypothetical protein